MTTVAEPTKPAISTPQQFRKKADKIAELQLQRKQIDSEIATKVVELKKQYPDEAKIDQKINELTRQCADWIFTDDNRQLVLFEGKKTGETQAARWKITTGKPSIANQDEYTDDEVIQLIEQHWENSGAIKEKKTIAKNILADWTDDDLASCGLKRIPAKETLKIEPTG